ncbi:MAG: hypothetical protein NTZ02_00195 [Candidatus Woesearchaeota archaeon]|nr:hypothetical protein [Candidatus Woesearchaeota archaeon]
MFLANTVKNTRNFIADVIDKEKEENFLLLFTESNENPLIYQSDAGFVVVSAIFGTLLLALKFLFRFSMSIFTTILIAVLIAVLSYIGILYFRWINRMAEEQKIAGIVLSLLAIAAVIIII